MGKPPSRVAQEAQEVGQRAAQVQKEIRELKTQLLNPQKHFGKRSDERTESAIQRFRRYFTVYRTSATERRKPTRAEARAQRARAIFWATVAFVCGIIVVNLIWRHFFRD